MGDFASVEMLGSELESMYRRHVAPERETLRGVCPGVDMALVEPSARRDHLFTVAKTRPREALARQVFKTAGWEAFNRGGFRRMRKVRKAALAEAVDPAVLAEFIDSCWNGIGGHWPE